MREIIIILLYIISFANAAEEKSILGYFDGGSFWIDSLDGYQIDEITADEIGAVFLLVPEGYTFNNAPCVIYSSVYYEATVKLAIERDKNNFSDYTITDYEKNTELDGYQIRKLVNTSSKQQPYEAVAYIQEGVNVVTIVLSSQNKKLYESTFPKYRAMLKSYKSANVKLQNKESGALNLRQTTTPN